VKYVEYSYLTVVLAIMVSDCDVHLFASEVEDCKQGAVCHEKYTVSSIVRGRYRL
jgi:hypothetical protein